MKLPLTVDGKGSKSRRWEDVEQRRFRLPAANQEGTPMDVAIRCIGMDPLQMVAGGRYELYSAYPIRVSAVPASIVATR